MHHCWVYLNFPQRFTVVIGSVMEGAVRFCQCSSLAGPHQRKKMLPGILTLRFGWTRVTVRCGIISHIHLDDAVWVYIIEEQQMLVERLNTIGIHIDFVHVWTMQVPAECVLCGTCAVHMSGNDYLTATVEEISRQGWRTATLSTSKQTDRQTNKQTNKRTQKLAAEANTKKNSNKKDIRHHISEASKTKRY